MSKIFIQGTVNHSQCLTCNAFHIPEDRPVLVTAKITNDILPPTDGCHFLLETSQDGQNWDLYSEQVAGTDASMDYTFVLNVPKLVLYIRAKFQGNTDEPVKVVANAKTLVSV
jgi:hypothetical protein